MKIQSKLQLSCEAEDDLPARSGGGPGALGERSAPGEVLRTA